MKINDEEFNNNNVLIMVTGRSNSGKTSLLNNIISMNNSEILPFSDQKNSAIPIFIKHQINNNEAYLLSNNNTISISGIDNIKNKVNEINKNIHNDKKYYSELELELLINIKSLNQKNYHNNIIFIDTPGIETNGYDISNWNHNKTIEIAKKSDIIIYLINNSNLSDEHVYNDLVNFYNNFNKNFLPEFYIIITHIDEKDELKKIKKSQEGKIFEKINKNIQKYLNNYNTNNFYDKFFSTYESFKNMVSNLNLNEEILDNVPKMYQKYITLIKNSKTNLLNAINKWNQQKNKSIQIDENKIIPISNDLYDNIWGNMGSVYFEINKVIDKIDELKYIKNIKKNNLIEELKYDIFIMKNNLSDQLKNGMIEINNEDFKYEFFIERLNNLKNEFQISSEIFKNFDLLINEIKNIIDEKNNFLVNQIFNDIREANNIISREEKLNENKLYNEKKFDYSIINNLNIKINNFKNKNIFDNNDRIKIESLFKELENNYINNLYSQFEKDIVLSIENKNIMNIILNIENKINILNKEYNKNFPNEEIKKLIESAKNLINMPNEKLPRFENKIILFLTETNNNNEDDEIKKFIELKNEYNNMHKDYYNCLHELKMKESNYFIKIDNLYEYLEYKLYNNLKNNFLIKLNADNFKQIEKKLKDNIKKLENVGFNKNKIEKLNALMLDINLFDKIELLETNYWYNSKFNNEIEEIKKKLLEYPNEYLKNKIDNLYNNKYEIYNNLNKKIFDLNSKISEDIQIFNKEFEEEIKKFKQNKNNDNAIQNIYFKNKEYEEKINIIFQKIDDNLKKCNDEINKIENDIEKLNNTKLISDYKNLKNIFNNKKENIELEKIKKDLYIELVKLEYLKNKIFKENLDKIIKLKLKCAKIISPEEELEITNFIMKNSKWYRDCILI